MTNFNLPSIFMSLVGLVFPAFAMAETYKVIFLRIEEIPPL